MRSVFDATAGPSSALTLVLCLVVQCCEHVDDGRNVLTDGKISMQSVRVFVEEKKLAQDDQKKGSPLGTILACIGLPIFVHVSLCDTGMRNR